MSTHGNKPDWRHDTLDALYALSRRRFLFIGIMALAAIIGLFFAAGAKPFYRASSTVVLLPREKPILDLSVQSSSVETSEDAAKRSSSATLTLPPNPDLYISIIRSREVTETVAETLLFEPEFKFLPLPNAAKIRASVSVESTEEGVLSIAMRSEHPEVAAAVVNALVRECEAASKSIERQLILQQSGFLGTAISHAEQRLTETRTKLDAFTEHFGVSDLRSVAARSVAILQTLDDTEARLSRELEGLRVHRTDLDSTVVVLCEELVQVRARREEVKAAYCGNNSQDEYARLVNQWEALQQDVRLRQDLLMSMRARHDVFSIRADQPAGNIAVIRRATPPSVPAGPSKRKFLVLSMLLGGFIAIAACVTADQLERMRKDPETNRRLASIVHSLWHVRSPRAEEIVI